MSNLLLKKGSCVDQEVDAIVNAANKYLAGGAGVCGEIFRRAGYNELTDSCQKYNTPLNDGDAAMTPAFNIKNAKVIIHAVGPDFSVTPDAYDKLYLAYYNSLKLVKENNLHSISFPLISSGIFGYGLSNPVQTSTEQCIRAYNNFIKENDYDIVVSLCAFSDSEYEEAKKIFR